MLTFSVVQCYSVQAFILDFLHYGESDLFGDDAVLLIFKYISVILCVWMR